MTQTTLDPDARVAESAPDDVTRVAVSTVIFTLRRDPVNNLILESDKAVNGKSEGVGWGRGKGESVSSHWKNQGGEKGK